MCNMQKVRQGFVTIERCANGKYRFNGLAVMGRDRQNNLANRLLWLHHDAPDWFRDLCNDYADTGFKVQVRVEKLHNAGVALVVPTTQSKEEALNEYTSRYGKPCDIKRSVAVVNQPTAFENCFKAHEFVANQRQLKCVAHYRDGLKSFTRAKDLKSGKEFMIVGGMLVNKIVSEFKPENPKWQQAIRTMVRTTESTTATQK